MHAKSMLQRKNIKLLESPVLLQREHKFKSKPIATIVNKPKDSQAQKLICPTIKIMNVINSDSLNNEIKKKNQTIFKSNSLDTHYIK